MWEPIPKGPQKLKNDGKLIGGKGRNKITVQGFGRLRVREVSFGWNCREVRKPEGL